MFPRIFIAVVLLAIAAPGCATSSLFNQSASESVLLPKASAYKSRHHIIVRGEVSQLQVNKIDSLLNVLEPRVIMSVKSLGIIDDEKHYNSPRDAAHCHYTRDICSKSEFLANPLVLWHEAAHAYHFQLDSQFERDWARVAGKVYGTEELSEYTPCYPRDGLLNAYSRKDCGEDVAEFMTEFYMAVTDRHSRFSDLRDKPAGKDPRYRQKVDLLLKYGFVRKENYSKFLRMFRFLSKDS